QSAHNDLQRQVTQRLEGAITRLGCEIEGVVHKVTSEALKRKAAQLGEIKQITKDPKTGTMTRGVEVGNGGGTGPTRSSKVQRTISLLSRGSSHDANSPCGRDPCPSVERRPGASGRRRGPGAAAHRLRGPFRRLRPQGDQGRRRD